MKKVFYLFLILLIAAGACSIKKRAYRPGYYIDWAFKKNKINPPSLNEKQIVSKKMEIAEKVMVLPRSIDPDIFNPTSINISLAESLKKKKINIIKDSACGDVITFRKGYEITAKVYEINETQVKYRPCDNLNGPLKIVDKNEVFSVKYPNGFIDVFKKTVYESNPAETHYQRKEVHPLAYVAVVCAFGILFLSVLAALAGIIVAASARRKILMEPNKYTGLSIANTAATICWIFLILITLLILLLLHFAGVI